MDVELFSDATWRILWLRRVAYAPMLERQEALVAEKIRYPGQTPDTLLLLEHEPVYTIGRTRDRSSLGSASDLPHPVETIHRGGQATYHGPGQLIGYPIIDLGRRVRDLHAYLRALEEVVILTLGNYQISAQRRAGLTGVWVGEQKIASIGIGLRRWVTLHGFAINISAGSLEPFEAITPCGIAGVTMTAAQLQTTETLQVESVATVLAPLFVSTLSAQMPVASRTLLQAAGQ